ncbi:YceI family protein [Pigmentibacter ruber]|uniref:YceI family protein n=1 Tax=Pigmentibacter ruber TaxID=2683196 RepID=UPI00131BD9F4|nr:YceI family protein [Pigmentibacter ruber]BFD31838.1 YceI family protein [Pigmentibacter ruber]
MRSIDLSKLLLLTSLIVTPLNVLANSSNKKTETVIAAAEVAKDYSIDPDHSKVSFEVAHLVISSVTGEFKKFKGTFKFNPEDFTQTQLDASAEINSIDTSVKKRDDHLKSPDFFDAKKFPVMTFKSKGAKKTGDKTFELMGDMTIKGITKPVTFKVTYNGQIKDNAKVLQAFKAVAEINRKDFGVNFQAVVEAGPVVGDTVTINIACEGTRKP